MPEYDAISLKKRLKRYAGILLETLFPGYCIACGRLYRIETNPGSCADLKSAGTMAAGFLCPDCSTSIEAIDGPLCIRCGRPFDSPHGPDHLCGDCIADTNAYAFHHARAAGRYEGSLRSLIHHLKYKGCVQIAKPLSRFLWDCVRRNWRLDDFNWILPVPLHPRRLRKRGFNQVAQLLRHWPKLAKDDCAAFDPENINDGLLVRNRHTLPQIGLDPRQRKANVTKAFNVVDPKAVEDAKILIVDDVFTTGSTVNACAASLMRSGAASVCAATLARSV